MINSRNVPNVDKFLFEILLETNDVLLITNVLESFLFRIRRLKYDIDISKFSTFFEKAFERIYKYNAAAAALRETYTSLEDNKRFYPLLADELEFRAKLFLENIFRAFRISYPDDPTKKFSFKTYYYDLLSTDRARKDNATTVLEQILPKHLYLQLYNLFTIEDFANKDRNNDFKEAAEKIYSGFDLMEEKLLEFLREEDSWFKILIIDYGQKKGEKNMLQTIDRVIFLKETELFKEVQSEALFLLAEKASDRAFHRGEYLLKSGELVGALFVIYKGEVDIVVGEEEKSVAVLGKKESLGEMELFRDINERYAVASVKAKSDEVICIVIKKSSFDEVFESNIELARAFIVSLGKRLEKMNEMVRKMEKTR